MKENKVVAFRKQFLNIKTEFETQLANIRSESDAKDLAADISNFLNSSDLTDEKKSELKSIRQKVYDKKRKIQISKPIRSVPENLEIEKDQNQKTNDEYYEREKSSFFRSAQFLNLFQKITIATIFLCFAIASMWFVFIQSIPLYQSIGFPNPRFCAAGAILMMVAFALFHWVTKSKILLLLCFFVSSYEVILVIHGTATHETILSHEKVEKNDRLNWLKEDANHKKESYDVLKIKYEDQNSKVYKNVWYKKKFLDPAWQDYSLAEEKVSETENSLSVVNKVSGDITLLKILFRLGLVFLVMISIRQFLKELSSTKQQLFDLFAT